MGRIRTLRHLRAASPGGLNLDFTSGALDGRITASGGANGTVVNSSGVLVAANAPRFDYNPSTLAPLGLLVEEARTNLLLNSLLNGTALSTQSVTVTAQAYTLSFYGTGSVTLSGTSTGTVTGTGAYPARVTSTFTPTAGSLTLTVSGNVQFGQLEAGSFATSFVPTGAAAVTRTADSVSMTGTNFSQWFNASAGTFVVEADTASVGDATAPYLMAACDPAQGFGAREEIGLNRTISAATANGHVSSAGATTFAANSGALTANSAFKVALAYAANDGALSVNGGAAATGASLTLPTVNTLRIGNAGWSGAVNFLNGHIRRLRYFPSRLPNASLQSLTA